MLVNCKCKPVRVASPFAKRKAELSVNEKLRHRRFVNRKEGFKELCVWLTRHKAESVHACLEATGRYGDEWALHLYEAGHVVSVINPAQIKAFGQSELLRNTGRGLLLFTKVANQTDF